MAPKSTPIGETVFDIAGNLDVCTCDDGINSIMQIVAVLGMTIKANCYNFCVEPEYHIELSD